MTLALDHLVVAARSLEEGAAWCVATLGVEPDAGGRHAFMGTHNRVLSVAGAQWPKAYLELIAIDPDAPHPGRPRWFDLDRPSLQAALAGGPRLVHWVMRCDDIEARCRALAHAGMDPGAVQHAERPTAHDVLRWRIPVRGDGALLASGALPTPIQWDGRHPADALPERGVALLAMTLAGLPPAVRACCDVAGMGFVEHGPALAATLATPRGAVTLASAAVV
jgi:hypothetical protein